MDLTQHELDALFALSDNRWHKATEALFFLHRKGLVDRRHGSGRAVDGTLRYEYQINQAGKDILNQLTDCQNPECPEAGRCGGECARNF